MGGWIWLDMAGFTTYNLLGISKNFFIPLSLNYCAPLLVRFILACSIVVIMRGQISICVLLAATTYALPGSKASPSDITACLSDAAVPQFLSGAANFTQSIKPFNLRLPFTPVAVAVPTTLAQVQATVACGVKLNITVTPKSGGHSYASHGLGGEDGHLMVDLKYWNTVSLDTTSGIATIGPGSRLGNVAQALYAQGKRAFSHGTCPG